MALHFTGAGIMPGPGKDIGASPHSYRMFAAMAPSLAIGFMLMLVAMMAPTLIIPIHHVCAQSFKHRRPRSIALFVLGYGALWLAAGGLLAVIVLTTEAVAPGSHAASAVAIILIGWQCSPIKQQCLNRLHNHLSLAAFGSAADWDALRFGTKHALLCVGSFWALMLFPMLLHHGHLPAMAVATFMVISERLDQPAPVRWEVRVPSKLARILVAQARIRL
ncbi:MAG: DUF2182 domain-containing protein [Gemmatimonadota bacterium]